MLNDEANFYMNGKVNCQTHIYWSGRNSLDRNHLDSRHWKSSCGVDYGGSQTVGSVFLDRTLNADKYLGMVQEIVTPCWMKNAISQLTSNKMEHLPTTLQKFEVV
jgi:hypothetical protein